MVNLHYVIFCLAWEVTLSSVFEAAEEDGNPIVFTDSPPTPKQEVPLTLIRRVNEKDITSVQEFIDNFVEMEPNKLELTSRIGHEDSERSAIRSAKMARCMPEMRTVPLVPENDDTIFYYPSCTRVERCGGCCAHRLLSCQPEESEIIHFSVVAAEYKGGNQLKFRKKEVVGVEQHKKCKCDCKVQKEDCTRYQSYNKEKCSCECQNIDDEKKCYEDRQHKIWNKDVCGCMCKEEQECSSGFYFDPFHCRCEPSASQRRSTRLKQVIPNFNRDFYNVSTNSEIFSNVMFRKL